MLDQHDTHAFATDHHGARQGDHLLEELLTHHYRPFEQEQDPRPLPEPEAVEAAVTGAMNALTDVLTDTCPEDDAPDLLWGFVNLFHRRVELLDRKLDDNEMAQKRSQGVQDGSEVRSAELERLIALWLSLTERRNAFEFTRDAAAAVYRVQTGSLWRPRSGSEANRRTMTAAMIESRDFLGAKRRAETEAFVPPGPRIGFTGGNDYQDVERIWSALARVKAKPPAMMLLRGGSPKGAKLIAAKWADSRWVPQVAFRPDWTKYAKAAPFWRNDAMLEAMPIGVAAFQGSGISENLADKARSMGIPVQQGVRVGA